jgi:3-hydroxyisobutyrate dehydrogenase
VSSPTRSPDDPVLFLGLGAMGTPMAAALARGGHDLLLRDVDEARAAALAGDLGATAVPAGDLAAATRRTRTVVLMLPDSPAVEAVLRGADGLLAHLPPGGVVVDMSSSRPSSTVALAAEAEQAGLAYVDAPVSGGVARARDATLAIMVGADEATYARVQPLLAAMGGDVTRVGGPGAGHAMKALNNLLSAIGFAAASEVLAVGANFGLDPQVMLDVLNRSTGRNHATEVKVERFVLSGAFDSGFSLRLMVKDLRTALELAHETGTPVPLSAGALEEWTAAGRTLPEGADHTHIAAYVETRAGTRLRTQPADHNAHTVEEDAARG